MSCDLNPQQTSPAVPEVRTARRSCKKAGRGRIFAPVRSSSEESRLERLGIGALTMKTHKGKDATAAYSPKKNHSVVIYTHKNKNAALSQRCQNSHRKIPRRAGAV